MSLNNYRVGLKRRLTIHKQLDVLAVLDGRPYRNTVAINLAQKNLPFLLKSAYLQNSDKHQKNKDNQYLCFFINAEKQDSEMAEEVFAVLYNFA